jgi:hypothetical protein
MLLGKLIVNIASVFTKADDRLLKHLERDSEWLQQQLGQFGPINGDFGDSRSIRPRAFCYDMLFKFPKHLFFADNGGGAASFGGGSQCGQRGADRHLCGSH